MAYNKETDTTAGYIGKKYKRGLILLADHKRTLIRTMLENLIDQACRAQGIDINSSEKKVTDTK